MSEPLYCPHLFQRFTICGYCVECAPDLHRQHDADMAAYVDAAQRFEAETGQHPLSDWYAFEQWQQRTAHPNGSSGGALTGSGSKTTSTVAPE